MLESCTYDSMRGRTYPAGASRSTLHPMETTDGQSNYSFVAKMIRTSKHSEHSNISLQGKGLSAARQRLRRLDRTTGARTRSALSDCIVRTVSFVFARQKYVATITLKEVSGEAGNIYAVEAVEINQDADSEVHLAEQCPRGLNSAPIQNLASKLAKRIAYYVGDVNLTQPTVVNRNEPFAIDRCAGLILEKLGRDGYAGG